MIRRFDLSTVTKYNYKLSVLSLTHDVTAIIQNQTIKARKPSTKISLIREIRNINNPSNVEMSSEVVLELPVFFAEVKLSV